MGSFPQPRAAAMIRYMDIEEQVDVDFIHARRRAFVRRIGARLRGDPLVRGAPSFEETRKSS